MNPMTANRFSRRPWRPTGFSALFIRCLPAFSLVLSLLVPAAWGQGSGVVQGRLVNKTDASIIPADVDLDVVGLGGGMSILKSGKSDKAGRFRIDGLPTDQPVMIRVNYKDINYHGRVDFGASGTAAVEIPVYEPTTSMAGIRMDRASFALQLTGSGLRSIEFYSFANNSNPPRSYMNMEGNFRFSKAPGITEPPKMSVTGPGSPMPLSQSPLESADGRYYYSLYPLRPGATAFEVDQLLPYKDNTYTFRKTFYYDVDSFEIGVIPKDITVTGTGLVKQQTDPQRNFAVYQAGPVRAGTEVVWTISGGTPVAEPAPAETQGEARVRNMPTMVSQNALILGPLLLIGFVVVLWYAVNHLSEEGGKPDESRSRALKQRRDQLLNYLASLDHQFENKLLERREYVRQREHGKRQLRRVSLLLQK